MALQSSLVRWAAPAAALFFWASAIHGMEAAESVDAIACVHELRYESFAGLVLVSVTIADSPPMDFVLDSGATQSSITDPYLAAALGLKLHSAGLARGMGSGATQVLVADDTCIRADGVELLCAPLVVHNIGVRLAAMAGRDIHGFLGADLFQRWVVEIDPSAQRLVLHPPDTFNPAGRGDGLPLEIVGNRAVVQAEVLTEGAKKPVPVRLVVDTGSGRFLTLISGSKRRLKPPESRSIGASVGVVGETLVAVAPVARLKVGSRVAEQVEAAWMEGFQIPAVRNIPKLNGILGNAFLGRHRTIIDYTNGWMILGEAYEFPDTSNENSD